MEVIHDKENRRFIMDVAGQQARVDYILQQGKMRLVYSEVPPSLRGKGVGRELVEGTFEKLTQEGYTAVAVCSFIRLVARRSAKWKDIIE